MSIFTLRLLYLEEGSLDIRGTEGRVNPITGLDMVGPTGAQTLIIQHVGSLLLTESYSGSLIGWFFQEIQF
jgi:hypothetical protein